jgi:transposase InsO family protein
MNEKLFFVTDCLREVEPFGGLCQRYGISRKTGYKWLERYRQSGLEGLEERSRRRRTQERIPEGIRQAIVQLRQPGKGNLGPKKIQQLLAERFADHPPPSRTSIYQILKAAGLVRSRRRRARTPAHGGSLLSCTEPNGLWSVDFKGQFRTGNGRWCYPLTVMDHASRFLVGCEGQTTTGFQATQAHFERLFREYGLPDRIRSDNGTPFATHGSAGLSRLSIWWIRLGIRPERIARGCPQQNGRHERMHRTLKQWIAPNLAPNLRAQQRELDAFKAFYNEQRPHEALKQAVPSSRYQASGRAFPRRLPPMSYPSYMTAKKVSSNGVIYLGNLQIYTGYLLTGETLGAEPVGDGLWDLHFGPLRLWRADEREARKGYLKAKLSPM